MDCRGCSKDENRRIWGISFVKEVAIRNNLTVYVAGLKIVPGLKRKLCEEFQRFKLGSDNYNIKSKRRHGDEKEKHSSTSSSSQLGCSKSQCAVEGILVKGFEGLFSTRPGLQFDPQSRVSSYTSYT